MYGILFLAALGADGSDHAANVPVAKPRRYHEINKDMRAWLRREAIAKTKPQRAEAVYELTKLYQELRRDPRVHDSNTLTEYKNKLWGRLIRIKKDIQREIAREKPKRKLSD